MTNPNPAGSPAGPPPVVRPTQYEVNCVPESIDSAHFAVTVEYRGADRWAVLAMGRRCLGRDRRWSYESIPSERRDDWLDAHRFDLDEALALAREMAPTTTTNGYTVADAIAMEETL